MKWKCYFFFEKIVYVYWEPEMIVATKITSFKGLSRVLMWSLSDLRDNIVDSFILKMRQRLSY